MASLMQDILNQEQPKEWTQRSYSGGTYVLENVAEDSEEFRSIEKEFFKDKGSLYKVTKLMRIQHPYLHGIYLINKERCKRLGIQTTEQRILRYLFENIDLDTLIRTNFDIRHGYGGYCYAKNEYFVQKNLVFGTRSCSYPEYIVMTSIVESVSSPLSLESLKL